MRPWRRGRKTTTSLPSPPPQEARLADPTPVTSLWPSLLSAMEVRPFVPMHPERSTLPCSRRNVRSRLRSWEIKAREVPSIPGLDSDLDTCGLSDRLFPSRRSRKWIRCLVQCFSLCFFCNARLNNDKSRFYEASLWRLPSISHITHKWEREAPLTVPRARTFLIEDMRKSGSEEPPPICAVATWLSRRAWPPCSRWLRSVPNSRSCGCSRP
jgi:hypothetical protein